MVNHIQLNCINTQGRSQLVHVISAELQAGEPEQRYARADGVDSHMALG